MGINEINGDKGAKKIINKNKKKITFVKVKSNLIFKDFKADFLRRAEGDVHFRCNQGSDILSLVEKTTQSGNRENMIVYIDALVPSISEDSVCVRW